MRIATIFGALAALAFAGCSSSKGLVAVTLKTGMPIVGIDHFEVNLNNAGAPSAPLAVAVPNPPFELDNSFSFVLAFDGRSGPLEIDVAAVDTKGATLASAKQLTHIDEGDTVTVTLSFDTFADMAMPDLILSDMAMADLTMPDAAMPDEAMHDQAMPDEAMPDASMHDMAMPDLAKPDLAMPDLATPDLAMPDLAKPDLAMPDLATPDLVPPPPPCTMDLSGAGTGDYSIDLDVNMLPANGTEYALANQRDVCAVWLGWDLLLEGNGALSVETDNQAGNPDTQLGTAAHLIDVGPHHIKITRTGGSILTVYIDGIQRASATNASQNFTTLPHLNVGTSPCAGPNGNGRTHNLSETNGQVTNVCLRP